MISLTVLLGASAAYIAPMSIGSRAVSRSAVSMAGDGTDASKFIGVDLDGLYATPAGQRGGKPPIKILARVEELRILSTIADAGLLSNAEANGVFTKLENAKAFSKVEKLLPLADDLKLLSTAESLLNVDASNLFVAGAALLAGEAALIAVVPDDSAALVGLQAVTGLAAGVGGIVLLGASSFFSLLQTTD